MDAPQIRSMGDAIVDRLLLLYLLIRNRRKGFSISGTPFETQLKLQKLLYWVEFEMFSNRYKGLNYYFFKWDHGPFAQEIYTDADDLLRNNLIIEDKRELRASEKGHELIENCGELFESNTGISNFFDRVIDRFGGYGPYDIRNATYAFPVFEKKIPIARVKKGELILPKMKSEDAEKIFYIDEEWMATLQIMFDPYFYSAIKTSLDKMKKDRGRPFRPVVRTPS